MLAGSLICLNTSVTGMNLAQIHHNKPKINTKNNNKEKKKRKTAYIYTEKLKEEIGYYLYNKENRSIDS